MTIRKDSPPLSILPAHTVILIEQAAARNADPEKVAADLGVALDVVLDCWHRMDILVGLVDGVEQNVQLTRGRPLTPCGTQAAQRRHRRAEERCETCRVWGATRQEASA